MTKDPDPQLSQVRALCMAVEDGDLQGVQRFLDHQYPLSHPKARNPLALSIGRADTPERWVIVDTLRAAGAQASSEQIVEAIKPSLKAGKMQVVEQALARGDIAQLDLDELICSVATSGQGDLVLRLLDLGAHPAAKPKNLFGSMFTAIELAAHSCDAEVTSAMAARLQQDEKDGLLRTAVMDGRAKSIPFLLDAGANANQTVGSRSLLELAPTKATDVRRILRAHKTAAKISAAMTDASEPPTTAPTSAGGSFVL